jgi:hypothetical protein
MLSTFDAKQRRPKIKLSIHNAACKGEKDVKKAKHALKYPKYLHIIHILEKK